MDDLLSKGYLISEIELSNLIEKIKGKVDTKSGQAVSDCIKHYLTKHCKYEKNND